MSRRWVAVLLAAVAALAGAPSSAAAATPNQLSQASVAPASGDASTLFVISVRYRSAAGNPAAAVTASGGGQLAILTLVSGSATDGVWSGAVGLPPGSWAVTLVATVVGGPATTLSAGIVNVAGSTAPPSDPTGNAPSSAGGPGSAGPIPSSSPAPRPLAPRAPRMLASPHPATSSLTAAPSQPPTRTAAGGEVALTGPARRGEAPVRSPQAAPSGRSAGAQRSPTATPGYGSAPAGGLPGDGREIGSLGLFILIGTLAVGAVALVGTAWVIVAGRREQRAAMAPLEPKPTDPGAIAAAIVEQRALRRARLRSSDDPIVAAMGLPDEDATPTTAAAPPARRRPPRRGGRGRPPAG